MRGFVFLGVCCLIEIGAGLSRVSMPPWVIACSSIRGAPTVFKCVWHVLDATLDQPGPAMQTRPRPGARGVHGVDSDRAPPMCHESLSRKCSSLQQEVRGFSIFALFSDWAGGFDQVVSALSGDVHCF